MPHGPNCDLDPLSFCVVLNLHPQSLISGKSAQTLHVGEWVDAENNTERNIKRGEIKRSPPPKQSLMVRVIITRNRK